jgi:hypothetical protein
MVETPSPINRHGSHDGWSAGSSDILLKEPSKDDAGQVWFKLAQWFQRRRKNYKK